MEGTRLRLQDALLGLSNDARLRRAAETRTTSHEIVRRYVAGESVSSAMDVAAYLAERGRLVSLTHLATEPYDVARTEKRAKRIRKVMRRLDDAGLTRDGAADVSVRLSALGACLGASGRNAAYGHLRELAHAGREHGVTVTVEVEDHVQPDVTLRLTQQVRREVPEVGIALQARNRRTESDIAALSGTGTRVRLTRGAPRRDASAFERGHAVDRAYVRCLQALLSGGDPVVVATHDERLLEIADALVRRYRGTPEQYGRDVEYQIRYGVRPEKQIEIADRGDRLRVYVPFGEDWYPYLAQRVADSPREIVALLRATR